MAEEVTGISMDMIRAAYERTARDRQKRLDEKRDADDPRTFLFQRVADGLAQVIEKELAYEFYDEVEVDLSAFLCIDCGVNTAPYDGISEYYMLTHELWFSLAGVCMMSYDEYMVLVDKYKEDQYIAHEDIDIFEKATGGMLCIGCLETRLGRRLVPEDFLDAPINNPLAFEMSTRLRSRVMGWSDL